MSKNDLVTPTRPTRVYNNDDDCRAVVVSTETIGWVLGYTDHFVTVRFRIGDCHYDTSLPHTHWQPVRHKRRRKAS